MLEPTHREVPMNGTKSTQPSNCLTRTCLKWTADGELTPLDLKLVLERLAAVDPTGGELQLQLDQVGLDPAA